MPHSFIGSDGVIRYRSKTMPLSLAASFARCLQANETRFCDVEITPAQRTKEEKFFVQFRPVNPDRQGDLYEAQYNARADRAQAEGMDYIFWADPDAPNTHWVFNPLSGETYTLTPFSCSCPDYQFRCNAAGLKCKHQHALQVQADAGTLGKTDKVTVNAKGETREEFHDRMSKSALLDW